MSPPRKILLGVVAPLGLVALILSGDVRRPTGPAEAGPILPPPRPGSRAAPSRPPRRLRLASFNIRSGRGTDERVDLRRTAAVLRGCDLVALQEVDGGPLGGQDQAAALAALLGTGHLFAPSETKWWHEAFGNGVLTTTAIAHWRRTPLPRAGRSMRNMVQLDVPFGSGILRVLITHSGLTNRAGQLEAVTAAFNRLAPPAVLMGDLNTHPERPEIRPLLSAEGVEDPVGERVGRR